MECTFRRRACRVSFDCHHVKRGIVNPPRAGHRVLIIASEPLLAALIGVLVELTGLRAAFARHDEAPSHALARVRPIAAILLDAVTDDASSDLFLARARRRKTPVLMFGSTASVSSKRSWATERAIPIYALPAEIDALQGSLERLRPPADSPMRQTQRREVTRARREPAGRLVFSDGAGARWTVYDRRSSDRRGEIDRRFVSDDGQVLRCKISIEEARSESATTLNEQLARAIAAPG